MRKIYPFIILLVLCFSCAEDPLDGLIPETSLNGSIQKITIFDLKTQRGKVVRGGLLITASVEVPYDIRREQVRPTLLACIKELKKRNRDCEWFNVFLCADGRVGIYAGRGEYREGTIYISYGIPSNKQLAEAEALREELDDYVPPKLLSKEEFNLAADLNELYYKYDNILAEKDLKEARDGGGCNHDVYDKLSDSRDDRVYEMIAKEVSIPEDTIRKLTRSLGTYYIFAWGSETIQ